MNPECWQLGATNSGKNEVFYLTIPQNSANNKPNILVVYFRIH